MHSETVTEFNLYVYLFNYFTMETKYGTINRDKFIGIFLISVNLLGCTAAITGNDCKHTNTPGVCTKDCEKTSKLEKNKEENKEENKYDDKYKGKEYEDKDNKNVKYVKKTKIFNIEEALEQCSKQGLGIPLPESDYRIQTLNRRGATSPVLDRLTLEFMEFSKYKRVLEIGGAYGKVMIEVLKKHPNTVYHLNDIEEKHLFIAANEAILQKIEESALKNIRLLAFDISEKTDVEEHDIIEKYDAILVARVLHFLSPFQITIAIKNLYNMLKSEGRVYVIAVSPYVKRYESFIPEYERRLANNEQFPGYVESLQKWLNKDVTSASQIASISEGPFMFFDKNFLETIFQKNNFKIKKCEFMELGYYSTSWSLDDREYVTLVAEKQ